jgi:tetratricopeptide (TPR) repeat protein
VLVLEAPAGSARLKHLQQHIDQARGSGAATWLLECHREEGGPWAGLRDLIAELVLDLQRKAPALIEKHDYELAFVLPELRRTLQVRNSSLTDVSHESERTRYYASDRAFRIPNGLVDLLTSWRPHAAGVPWVIACNDFDHSGTLTRMFFTELMRRRGRQLDLRLIVAVAPGSGEAVLKQFDASIPSEHLRLSLPVDPVGPPPDPEEMGRRARALAPEVPDMAGLENVLPRLIRLWLASNEPERALQVRVHALSIYTTRGFYADALLYGEPALAQLEQQCPDDLDMRMRIYNRLSNCYAALDRPQQGLAIAQKAMASTQNPRDLLAWCYIMAMYHARYLPNRDYALAESYLEQGLRYIEQSGLPLHDRLFRKAFNRNGLAMIRHFQKRYDEAITLCRTSFDELNAHLQPDEHRLHRSVLLYNIAQVYSAVGRIQEAITMYTEAMEIDPNYSEYYNERGGLYLKTGRPKDAERDLLRAIDLSPPYMEAWVNLGQSYCLLERWEDAVAAYSRALDLNPRQAVALAGRGQAYEELGQMPLALEDYEQSLRSNAAQPQIYANRAVLHYQAGNLNESLEDLNKAIQLAPGLAELYHNRATAFRDLGRLAEAERDLHRYLELNSDAEDRAEIEQQLAELQSLLVTTATIPDQRIRAIG